MEVSGADSVSTKYDPIQYRRDRINSLRQSNIKSDDAEDDSSSEKIKSDKNSPFERFVKTIKKSDLTLGQKKAKLHYAKSALSRMDDKQAKTFVRNLQKLLSFKNPNLSHQTSQPTQSLLEKQLTAQLEQIEKLIEKLDLKDDQKTKNPFYANSIDQYVDYLNNTFGQFDQDLNKEDKSIDVLS